MPIPASGEKYARIFAVLYDVDLLSTGRLCDSSDWFFIPVAA
jgi:hypothetical protein